MKKFFTLCIFIGITMLVSACGTENESLKVSDKAEFKQEDYKQIVPSNNALGFQVLSEVEPNDDGNIFISPTSLSMALSMIYNGADGETKNEIAKAMHTTLEPKEVNHANASLINMLYKNSEGITLEIANSLWLIEQFHFQETFKDDTQNYFNGKIEEIDLTDSKSAERINDWVKKVTHGNIDHIVESPLNQDFVSILINAMYFKGDWTYPFDPELTENRTFTLANGTIKETSFMQKTKKWVYLENDTFQAICLPYGDEENMTMKIFLPKEDVHINEFQSMMTMDNWKNWNNEFEYLEGTILLPKFQLSYETELNDVLKWLGMETAFKKGAQFTKMIQEEAPLWISKVKQKTYIDVNEAGTEAAAVTSLEVATEMAPVVQPFMMEVNRPFFLAITDDKTESILFLGIITNPTEES